MLLDTADHVGCATTYSSMSMHNDNALHVSWHMAAHIITQGPPQFTPLKLESMSISSSSLRGRHEFTQWLRRNSHHAPWQRGGDSVAC